MRPDERLVSAYPDVLGCSAYRQECPNFHLSQRIRHKAAQIADGGERRHTDLDCCNNGYCVIEPLILETAGLKSHKLQDPFP